MVSRTNREMSTLLPDSFAPKIWYTGTSDVCTLSFLVALEFVTLTPNRL